MSIQERLQEIKEIAQLSMAGRTDEEIANIKQMSPWKVKSIRNAVGLGRRQKIDITKDYKRARVANGTISLTFSIPREYATELNLDPEKLIDNVKHKFTGQIKNGKLILKIVEV